MFYFLENFAKILLTRQVPPRAGNMSKRSKSDSGAAVEKAAPQIALEAKLHELQSYAYEMILKNNNNQEGSVRSTRAFADPLLNLEIKLMQEREGGLTSKIQDLEKSLSRGGRGSHQDNDFELIKGLRKENEELRQQLGEVGQQMRSIQLEIKDKRIEELASALGDCRGFIASLKEEKQAQSTEILQLKMRIKDLQASYGGNNVGEGSDNDSSDGEGDQFDSFFDKLKTAES